MFLLCYLFFFNTTKKKAPKVSRFTKTWGKKKKKLIVLTVGLGVGEKVGAPGSVGAGVGTGVGDLVGICVGVLVVGLGVGEFVVGVTVVGDGAIGFLINTAYYCTIFFSLSPKKQKTSAKQKET